MDRTTVTIVALGVLIFGGIIGGAVIGSRNFKPYNQCVEHSVSLSMHIHPELSIIIDGQPQPIPANIGIDPTCMKAVHTHDETGKIHLEYPDQIDFKLADFFTVWGQPFSKDQILDKKADDTHTIIMTVDGQPSTDFENLILKDAQKIEIRYETKQAAPEPSPIASASAQ